MFYDFNYLAHYGVSGQKWGIRRYQNSDGTLTEEGRSRYYDSLTPKQQQMYNRMSPKNRARMLKKLVDGKSWTRSVKEMASEAKTRQAIAGVGIGALILYANPLTRMAVKIGAKQLARTVSSFGKMTGRMIKNSKAFQKGSLWINQIMKRRQMVKNGGIVLNKKQYSVKDTVTKFGGYLA